MIRKTLPTTASILMLLFLATLGTQFVCLVPAQTSGATSTGEENNGPSTALFQGWQVMDYGGYYSESDGAIRLWSDATLQGVTLYKEISPETDFQFSLKVKAISLNEGFGIVVGGSRCFLNNCSEKVTFEFHYNYGARKFLLARYVNTVIWETGKVGNVWDGLCFAYGEINVWYTMILRVQKNPFKVSGEVLEENGRSLGSLSVSDMINLTFEDISCLGFTNAWGGDFYVRNISDVNPISKSTTQTRLKSFLSISTDLYSSFVGSTANIAGRLSDSNGTGLANKTVLLHYTFPGTDLWFPISSALTDNDGNYIIQWLIPASGTFTLRITWDGDKIYDDASNTTTLDSLLYENKNAFIVESNSTVTSLAFNSTSSELSFTVSGPSGTAGYVKATVAKSILSNGEDAKLYLDGNQLHYVLAETADSWIFNFKYPHSIHQVTLDLSSNANSSDHFPIPLVIVTSGLFVAVVGIGLAIYFRKCNRQIPKTREVKEV